MKKARRAPTLPRPFLLASSRGAASVLPSDSECSRRRDDAARVAVDRLFDLLTRVLGRQREADVADVFQLGAEGDGGVVLAVFAAFSHRQLTNPGVNARMEGKRSHEANVAGQSQR